MLFVDARPAMGTEFEVRLYAPTPPSAEELFAVAFEEIERVEANLSTYRPTSEISRINGVAGTRAVTTDPETFALLSRAREYGRRSAGAFDVTVGVLVAGRPIAAWGWEHLELDAEARTVCFRRPGLTLDLGAIGKGYTIDRVVDLLRGHGVQAALIGSGQSTYFAIGAPPGETGWRINVPAPADDPAIGSLASGALPDDNLQVGDPQSGTRKDAAAILLRDRALSTSGVPELSRCAENVGQSHILDPRTGHPVQGMVQVTVLAADATEADALSTALFVAGARERQRLLAEFENSAARLVIGTRRESRTVDINWPRG